MSLSIDAVGTGILNPREKIHKYEERRRRPRSNQDGPAAADVLSTRFGF